jgi:hypothetical protein
MTKTKRTVVRKYRNTRRMIAPPLVHPSPESMRQSPGEREQKLSLQENFQNSGAMQEANYSRRCVFDSRLL